ncbi:MAG: DUF2914 domain-containing protein [Salinisphaera sp.]|nr:DUF2914 domain-containing protein [Salinisphaera sp.]
MGSRESSSRNDNSARDESSPGRVAHANNKNTKATDIKSAPPHDVATAERPSHAQDGSSSKPETRADKAERHADKVEASAHNKPAETVETTQDEDSAPANGQAASRSVISSHVARAQLTSGIKDMEPVDRVTDVFHSNHKSLRHLYYFTDLVGLRGETVTHSWWHEGRRIARVTSHVRSNSWRMSSSKKLIPSMAGPWRVVATDSQGNTLSVARFVYQVP